MGGWFDSDGRMVAYGSMLCSVITIAACVCIVPLIQTKLGNWSVKVNHQMAHFKTLTDDSWKEMMAVRSELRRKRQIDPNRDFLSELDEDIFEEFGEDNSGANRQYRYRTPNNGNVRPPPRNVYPNGRPTSADVHFFGPDNLPVESPEDPATLAPIPLPPRAQEKLNRQDISFSRDVYREAVDSYRPSPNRAYNQPRQSYKETQPGISPERPPVDGGPQEPVVEPVAPPRNGYDGRQGQKPGVAPDGYRKPAPTYPQRARPADPCASCKKISCPSGPPGPAGRAGRDGRQGPSGLDGLPGLPAPDVEPVVVDPPCVTCPEGPPGPPGQPGDVGADGRKGPLGQHGIPGRPGVSGAMGGKGLAGKAGPKGGFGGVGMPGLDLLGGKGKPGIKGAPGSPGANGLPGTPGKSFRAPGSPGQRGAPGGSGPRGFDGLPGLQGPIGERGQPGSDGQYCPCPEREMRPYYQAQEGGQAQQYAEDVYARQ